LEEAYPVPLRHLASFPGGDASALRRRLGELLALPEADRRALHAAARAVACERWSWAGVAARLLAPVA